ncbi:MAG: esterase-like activity of phytase family protein [Alphaproteobacteria bacterium]|nr:esterase-like activity of phytase family protein [Alphaproteobacteria bacterium]MCW5742851.1 esterase-like activity of phytase family protein [Alphaproteobacteria bacterium]
MVPSRIRDIATGLPALVVALWLATACSTAAREPAPAVAIEIEAHAIPLNVDEPTVTEVGKLRWRGGLVLTSPEPRFGGWSDLWIGQDGRALRSVSDEGSWLAATLRYDKRGHLVGVASGMVGSLRGEDGRLLAGKLATDAEGLARLPDGGWLVSFERDHRVMHYPPGEESAGQGLAGRSRRLTTPPEFRWQPVNGGVEAMAVLPDRRTVLLSEAASERPGTVVGWLVDASATWHKFHYQTRDADHRPTSMALLPDGDLVVLERAFDFARGARVAVKRLTVADLRPNTVVRGEELAWLRHPFSVDNLEGVAAVHGPRGGTLLWLLSDNNFNPLQRTILLHFELTP